MRQRNGDKPAGVLLDEAVLYLSAFVVSATGVWAATMTTDSPALQNVFLLALAAGFGVSWRLRRYQGLRDYGVSITVVLMGAALIWFRATGTFLGQAMVLVVGQQRQMALVMTLAAFTILRSYGLLQVGDLLFCVVPGLAIFGLMGTEALESRFTIAFLAFVFSAAYLAGQAHLMGERARSRLPSAQDARRVARERLVILALLFALSAGLAVPASRALAALIPQYGIPTAVAPAEEEPAQQAREASGRQLWSSLTSLAVGTGPIRLDTRVVMRVQCAEPLLWRAGSLSRYTGSGWKAAPRPATRAPAGADGAIALLDLLDAPAGRLVKQGFQFQQPSDIIFAAMQPVQVNLSPGSVYPRAVNVDAAGSLSSAGRLARPDMSYEVLSQVTDLIPRPGARSVLAANGRELLSIPNNAREIERYAREAVGDITRPAARVDAIVSYLRARATYRLDAPATPPGEDAVIYFLAHSRAGYCDLFASAAALMCRALGIPARVAVGYASGDYILSAGAYIVRESDAHAWAEVYLPDQGWVTVDPTPPAQGPATPLPPSRESWLARLSSLVRGRALYLLAALAVLAWAGRAMKARWLDDYLALRRRERSLRADDHRGSVILCYEKVVRAFARRGLARRAWETPSEYARRLGKGAYLAVLMPTLAGITGDYLMARFAQGEVSGEQSRRARAALMEIAARLRRIKRLG